MSSSSTFIHHQSATESRHVLRTREVRSNWIFSNNEVISNVNSQRSPLTIREHRSPTTRSASLNNGIFEQPVTKFKFNTLGEKPKTFETIQNNNNNFSRSLATPLPNTKLTKTPDSLLFKPPEAQKTDHKIKPKKGYCVILNQKNINIKNIEKHGSKSKDVKYLQSTLKRFNFKCVYHKDLTLANIESKINKLKKKDFRKYSMLIIFTLTHAKDRDILSAKDRFYNYEMDLINPILTNKSLSDKPKIFFFSLCHSKPSSAKVETDARSISSPNANILKVFSRCDGCASNENYFVRGLCDIIKNYVETLHLSEMISKLTVSLRLQKDYRDPITTESTLTDANIYLRDYLK